jgi:hypothetical protein
MRCSVARNVRASEAGFRSALHDRERLYRGVHEQDVVKAALLAFPVDGLRDLVERRRLSIDPDVELVGVARALR